jgi:hypothetical protein
LRTDGFIIRAQAVIRADGFRPRKIVFARNNCPQRQEAGIPMPASSNQITLRL